MYSSSRTLVLHQYTMSSAQYLSQVHQTMMLRRVCLFVAFVGKLSFADVVKSPARSVIKPLMSRENLPSYQPTSRFVPVDTVITAFYFELLFPCGLVFLSVFVLILLPTIDQLQ